jgi:tetratricopeptide (TPR) repeat protein
MKRAILTICVIFLTAGYAFTQDQSFVYESDNYRVRSHLSAEHAQTIANHMEALASLYNSYFHFNKNDLNHKLRVQIFRNKADFDRYLQRLIGETRNEFVYLHFSDISRSELVGFHREGNPLFRSIAHQGFIQFLRSFVPNPPLWMREGFAVYFEEAEVDANFAAAMNRQNLNWLETLKDLLFGSRQASAITPDQMLSINVEAARDQINVFYPQAWGVVHYLINSPSRSHNRILWSAISALDPQASLIENSQRVYEAAFRWVPEEILLESFLTYFDQLKTLRELIEGGVASYEADNLADAELQFVQAISRQDTSYIPHYYLGLINYDRGNFSLAQFNFERAIEMGADPAITNFALGVNAFADNRYTDAQSFLEITLNLDPDRFSDRVNLILERIEF